MNNTSPLLSRVPSIKIVSIYALFGLFWVHGSEVVLGWFVSDPAMMAKIAVAKGSLFILCTALLLYALITRFIKQVAAERIQAEQSLRRERDLSINTNLKLQDQTNCR